MSDAPVTYARIAGLRAAAAAEPASAAAQTALGSALWWAGQREAGLERLTAAVRLQPDNPEALTNLGNALAALGRTEEAVAHYDAARAGRPDDFALHYNTGCAWLTAGETAKAEASFRAALAHCPDHGGALNNLGSVLRAQGRAEEALPLYRRAAALRPEVAGIHNNLGAALLALKRFEEALPHLRDAARLRPDDLEICNNLGGALLAIDRPEEALRWFRHALRRDPRHHQAHFGEAMALLVQGAFRDGWAAYEARWDDPDFTRDERRFDQPQWDGGAEIAGCTVLLHAEQGLGDTLQFVRYTPLLRCRGAGVVLQVQAPVLPLVRDLADKVIDVDLEPPPHDLHCPLLSLPLAFGTDLATVPADIPYLRAPPDRFAAWAGRLGARTQRRVGIAVSGDPAHPDDALRSIPANLFLRAFAGVPADLHVLQTGLRDTDAAALAGARMHDIGDLGDTAALVALMDVVVTVDTVLAHLAGAMGAPAWILLQHAADFRWLRGRTDSPWYPTARLFRQPRPNDWAAALEAVNAELRRTG